MLRRGCKPVLLDCSDVTEEGDVADFRAGRRAVRARLPKELITIEESPDDSAVLEQVRALDPIMVIAGSEFDVPYATRLAAELGLPGNPMERLKAMTEKDSMHKALEEHGIQHAPVHGEFMIDENGPVLTEVNCRQDPQKRPHHPREHLCQPALRHGGHGNPAARHRAPRGNAPRGHEECADRLG